MDMEWEGFEIVRDDGSFLIQDGDFSIGVDSENYPVIQLLTDEFVESGEVTTGKEDLDVDGDFEPLEPGNVVDIYGVVIRAFEGESLSYWFKMGSKSFYFSSRPGEKDGVDRLENSVDVAFLEVDDESIEEAVKIKPRLVIPYGFDSERDVEQFALELRDRSIDVKII